MLRCLVLRCWWWCVVVVLLLVVLVVVLLVVVLLLVVMVQRLKVGPRTNHGRGKSTHIMGCKG